MRQLMPQAFRDGFEGRGRSLTPGFNGNSIASIWSGFNNLFWKDDKTLYNSSDRLLLRPPDFVPGGLTLSPFKSLSLSLNLYFLPD